MLLSVPRDTWTSFMTLFVWFHSINTTWLLKRRQDFLLFYILSCFLCIFFHFIQMKGKIPEQLYTRYQNTNTWITVRQVKYSSCLNNWILSCDLKTNELEKSKVWHLQEKVKNQVTNYFQILIRCIKMCWNQTLKKLSWNFWKALHSCIKTHTQIAFFHQK